MWYGVFCRTRRAFATEVEVGPSWNRCPWNDVAVCEATFVGRWWRPRPPCLMGVYLALCGHVMGILVLSGCSWPNLSNLECSWPNPGNLGCSWPNLSNLGCSWPNPGNLGCSWPNLDGILTNTVGGLPRQPHGWRAMRVLEPAPQLTFQSTVISFRF